MDQGWGGTGDSGVMLYMLRGEEAAGGQQLIEDPVIGVTFDRRRSSSTSHKVTVDGINAAMAPQAGDRFRVFLQCPSYPAWFAHCEEIRLLAECTFEEREEITESLPENWRARSDAAFFRMWAGMGDGEDSSSDAYLRLDLSHLSLSGQRQQLVFSSSSASNSPSGGPSSGDTRSLDSRLQALLAQVGIGKGGDKVPAATVEGAGRLLGKLEADTPAAGAPPSPEARSARYQPMRQLVLRTLAALGSGKACLAAVVLQHYADCADDCIYRWEREIHNMHDLVTGDSTGTDAQHIEDVVLRLLHSRRRQLAEGLLHRTKGRLTNMDMHFESFFYASIHFGLTEQDDARRDPNRLNYLQLNLLQPGDLQQELMAAYTPALIRQVLRQEIFDSKQEGSQLLREKLMDWLRAHVPLGFRAGNPDEQRLEAWLFSYCHDDAFRVRDEALNYMLCNMHLLSADALFLPARARAAAALDEACDPRSHERVNVAAAGRQPDQQQQQQQAWWRPWVVPALVGGAALLRRFS
ncbi:unnamed protein product [Polarella glacialis]|uniref:Uncharacterized protein n=1 Tax=Polarella glacialis TaxID=89957 RepID=A0A813DYF6_POLGL|nr:unnamed protein product [Polarella glacialis]